MCTIVGNLVRTRGMRELTLQTDPGLLRSRSTSLKVLDSGLLANLDLLRTKL